MKKRITATLIAKLRPQARPYDVVDDTERRLLLRVNRTGAMTYFARYRMQGSSKWTRIKLGNTATLTPDQARAKAVAVRKMVDDGKDPGNKRMQKRLTLREFVESHYAPTHLAMRKTGKETLDRLNACFPSFMDTPMEAVSAKKIDEWRARRKADGVAAATINRDVTTLKACLSKAVEWGYIEEHPLVCLKPLRTDSHPTVRYPETR